MDLSTVAGAKDFARSMGKLAAENFRNQGELMSIAFILATEHPTHGKLDRVRPVICPGFSDVEERVLDSKEFATTIRRACRDCNAVGVVTILETWRVTAKTLDEVDRTKSLEHHPGREEGLFLTLEHAWLEHPWVLWGLITRPEGKPVLADYKEEIGYTGMSGRFTKFVPEAVRTRATA